jgi:hypothetical protein
MATIFVAVNAQAHVSSVNDAIVRVAIYLTLGFTVASGIHYLLTLPQRAGQHSSDEAAPVTSESAKRE